MYCKRLIDKYLSEWASGDIHKPLLLRGARQVGKSTAVQATKKFIYSKVGPGYRTVEVQKAVELLTLAGILHPVIHTRMLTVYH